MSVTMTRAEGVMVFTVTSDPNSRLPPLCQILKSLCYSPACGSLLLQPKKVQRTPVPVLGVMHIMIRLLNTGLGLILHLSHTGALYLFVVLGFPYWLGTLFILFGIMCILSDKYPSPCLILTGVILNLAGALFALTAVGLYASNVPKPYQDYGCSRWYDQPYPTPQDKICSEGKALIKGILMGVNSVLIILSVLEFCVATSSAFLGIKALKSSDKTRLLMTQKQQLDEVTTKPAAESLLSPDHLSL